MHFSEDTKELWHLIIEIPATVGPVYPHELINATNKMKKIQYIKFQTVFVLSDTAIIFSVQNHIYFE